MSQRQEVVGSISERLPSSGTSSSFRAVVPKSGFPVVQHRSMSAFARSRNDQKNVTLSERISKPPVVIHPGDSDDVRVPSTSRPQTLLSNSEDWREQMSNDNEKRVEALTNEEREQERREILERFGSNVGDILKRAREAREHSTLRLIAKEPENPQTLVDKPQEIPRSPLKVKLQSQGSTPTTSRPSSRADRKIRFADVTPDDVYVYESTPSSPRKKPLALLPLSDSETSDIPVTSLGTVTKPPIHPREQNHKSSFEVEPDAEPEEGSPEYIRRRYFPDQPAFDPSLAWIQSSEAKKDPDLDPSSTSLRFDLAGRLIPVDLRSTLPTHLGLHHHADGRQAGYTMDDLFLLSRSTVPAQRSLILGILSHIVAQLSRNAKCDYDHGIPELKGQEDYVRRRVLAAGIEAMGERGSVGAMAVEIIWECIVHWEEELDLIDGVELQQPTALGQSTSMEDSDELSGSRDIISSLPLEKFVLPQMSDVFASAVLPPESLLHLLSVLHHLARYTNEIANLIVTTPNIIANLFHVFILTPIPPADSSALPNPRALDLLCTLTSASRTNALALKEPADALLRFVTPLPPNSPYPTPLATSLLTSTLRLYSHLASYGIYSHVATTASIQFSRLNKFVLSADCDSQPLRVAWLGLVESWIVCATNPHKTTPSHDILWSQISAWYWGPDALAFKSQLTSDDSLTWVALWRLLSAWLEGAQSNAVRAGETERVAVIGATEPGFRDGVEKAVVTAAFKGLKQVMEDLLRDEQPGIGEGSLRLLRALAEYANVLAASLRLWVSCMPPLTEQGTSLQSPPFSLPFPQLADLSAQIVNHPIWAKIYSEKASPYAHVFFRPLTLFLSSYLRLSRRLPTSSQDLWLAQAFVVICRLIPGDEEFGMLTVEKMLEMLNQPFFESRNMLPPSASKAILETGGMDIIRPFLIYAFNPRNEDVRIGPLYMSPQSISESTTQRLPSARLAGGHEYMLPLSKDWIFTPLNHLLRSGTSSVIKALPASWDGSEVGIVRATLLLAKVLREVLARHGLQTWQLSLAETVFGCMKVFMLEHEQHNENSVEEVYRDMIVEGLMADLLKPFTASSSPPVATTQTQISANENLETVAIRFLGRSTPFYQYYTDFVGLYDAVSFGHPIFSQLLIVPTSTRYPLEFRKYLWGDYGHALRNVRTKPKEVLVEVNGAGLSEYLWPVERDPQVLGCYLSGLIKKGALVEDGVMRLVAIHHIASNVWEDLRSPEVAGQRTENDIENGSKLLKAVVDQGSFEAVRDVVKYTQHISEGERLLLPPECFNTHGGSEWATRRLQFINRVGGNGLRERLEPLLQQI